MTALFAVLQLAGRVIEKSRYSDQVISLDSLRSVTTFGRMVTPLALRRLLYGYDFRCRKLACESSTSLSAAFVKPHLIKLRKLFVAKAETKD